MESTELYILEIYEQRNLTKAAKKLKITQPALSLALLSLENKLGYSLFDRKKSPLAITPEGEAYYSFLCQKRLLETKLHAEIESIHNENAQQVTIGAPSAYISEYVLPCINSLLLDYPRSKIRIVEGTVPYLVEEALKGNIDFFVSTTNNLPDQFALDTLSHENVFLCSLSDIPIAPDGFPAFEQLSDSIFIKLGENQPLQIQINNYLHFMNFQPSRTVEVDQVTSALKLCSLGCGLCFATTGVFSDMSRYNRLYAVKLPDSYFNRVIYLASVHEHYFNAAQLALINILKKHGGNTNEVI
ncbi:MAG: LysR family transcriptional regulator [Oscillospiraceae bacterium]|nr:LysR family transcriptional regulator [Oscillospiraceae bacterium]